MWDDLCNTQSYRDMFRDEYERFTQHNYIIREEEYYKTPKKELTAEEQFEELKNKIKKPIEIKRKKNCINEHPNSFFCIFALMFIMCLAGALIIAVNVKGV